MSEGGFGIWGKVVAFGAAFRRWLSPEVILIAVLVLAVAAGAAVWADAMVTPVHRTGQPTITFDPTPAPPSNPVIPTPTPTPSLSASPAPTPSATPSAAKPPSMKSSGKFLNANKIVNAAGSAGTLRTYLVRTETTSGLDVNKAATQIAATLNDPRSWVGSGNVRFALVSDPAKASFVITLAAPGTAAKSCKVASGTCLLGTEVVIDAVAWKNTPGTYAGNGGGWRTYLANHGVGTLLGKKPASCTKQAKPAPVMMAQQTDLGGCMANPWPFP